VKLWSEQRVGTGEQPVAECRGRRSRSWCAGAGRTRGR